MTKGLTTEGRRPKISPKVPAFTGYRDRGIESKLNEPKLSTYTSPNAGHHDGCAENMLTPGPRVANGEVRRGARRQRDAVRTSASGRPLKKDSESGVPGTAASDTSRRHRLRQRGLRRGHSNMVGDCEEWERSSLLWRSATLTLLADASPSPNNLNIRSRIEVRTTMVKPGIRVLFGSVGTQGEANRSRQELHTHSGERREVGEGKEPQSHEHLPRYVADADEGVDDVGAVVGGNVVDGVAANVWPVDGPVAEVADDSTWSSHCGHTHITHTQSRREQSAYRCVESGTAKSGTVVSQILSAREHDHKLLEQFDVFHSMLTRQSAQWMAGVRLGQEVTHQTELHVGDAHVRSTPRRAGSQVWPLTMNGQQEHTLLRMLSVTTTSGWKMKFPPPLLTEETTTLQACPNKGFQGLHFPAGWCATPLAPSCSWIPERDVAATLDCSGAAGDQALHHWPQEAWILPLREDRVSARAVCEARCDNAAPTQRNNHSYLWQQPGQWTSERELPRGTAVHSPSFFSLKHQPTVFITPLLHFSVLCHIVAEEGLVDSHCSEKEAQTRIQPLACPKETFQHSPEMFPENLNQDGRMEDDCSVLALY
ncbi:hypothetical protein PR048_025559 [Dryococelus australis]|uniref:Uncharacterized protein n=1 Tax=Dryococelus australis TaxID=614101 RepID=A0ABQ9GRQ6_9NEOP|nr:hypothetical protein PR048_025559 [Dryococelus australis]